MTVQIYGIRFFEEKKKSLHRSKSWHYKKLFVMKKLDRRQLSREEGMFRQKILYYEISTKHILASKEMKFQSPIDELHVLRWCFICAVAVKTG